MDPKGKDKRKKSESEDRKRTEKKGKKKKREQKEVRRKSREADKQREEALQARVVGASTSGPPKDMGNVEAIGKYSTPRTIIVTALVEYGTTTDVPTTADTAAYSVLYDTNAQNVVGMSTYVLEIQQ